ncbi:5-bromo-4-chloroindolyl phosphate hydrolysis family protein [Pseudoflavonifractor phocaeensis]|uniref:5-bromo-4-chloroindolyl phosphate hydrolysis family protein n=1 Tax=Pseudoflavonifractor phocaeensis TaxID=1870988 RepID=UPI00195A4003|nr:5-bromo-4-chloroindolyl phosphate hydrolysis family protein [Pseudoflavonifractor phocaeensis]MBM6926654.1 5-bromo-4-chloroindolyl phosphate hydrolysis family protein [Pseudoflavonifractor phocaeensis]
MAYYRNDREDGPLSWILPVILLVTPLWFVGVILLLRKLKGPRRPPSFPYLGPSPVGGQRSGPVRTPNVGRPGGLRLEKGKVMTVAGAAMAILFGIAAITGVPSVASALGFPLALATMSPVLGLCAGGLALMGVGSARTRKARRFRKYLALIGRREKLNVVQLAHAMPVPVRKACNDLQEMLDEGILPRGYLDMSTHQLILSDEGLDQEPPPEEEKQEPQEEAPLDLRDDDAVLREIRRLNDDIDDEAMSRKIDRIGEITSKIYGYVKQNPSKEGELRQFLNYYLPTTLKILKAYARMEDQGVEGENIRAAKARIEGMMDKVVEGFEKQLDRLFEVDTMDVTADVEVLERMLEKDGLAGGLEFERPDSIS